MSRRRRRVDQSTLNEYGTTTRHEFQNLAVKELMAHGWRVSSVNYDRDVVVVVCRMISDNSIGTAVYPNGSFARSKSPTIKWEWKRARDQATATIPDPYVAAIIEREKGVSK